MEGTLKLFSARMVRESEKNDVQPTGLTWAYLRTFDAKKKNRCVFVCCPEVSFPAGILRPTDEKANAGGGPVGRPQGNTRGKIRKKTT